MIKNSYPHLFFRWQKLTCNIYNMHITGRLARLPAKVCLSLFKKWKRYTRKLLTVNHPLVKAVNIFCIATSLSFAANAQCNIFSISDANNPIIKITQSNSLSNAGLMDIDNDSDLDCYETYVDAAQQLQFVLLRNTGTSKLPRYVIDTADGFPNTGVGTSTRWNGGLPRFADVDGDGDYDCFISLYDTNSYGYSRIYFYENIGGKTTPNFVRNDSKNPLAVSGHYFIDFNLADVDGDGDYDMVFADLYYSRFFENVGTKTNPLFVMQTGSNNPFLLTGLYGDESFYDWNKDGLPDYGFSENGEYYKNVGTIGEAKFVLDAQGPKTGLGYSGQWVDINKDGFTEIISRGGSMEATAPEATMTRKKIGNDSILLTAFPQGNFLYKWRKNGKIIKGEKTISIVVKGNGFYSVEITDSCGTGLSLPYRILNLNIVNSFQETNTIAKNDNTNKIFPNPFTTEFTIQLNNSFNKICTIRIADVNGKIVSEFQSSGNIIHTGKQLQPGLYFIQVLQNNAVVYKQKIIKQ